MLNGYIVTSAIIALAFIILGLGVLYRNPKASINRFFLIFSVSTALWLATNYLASTASISYGIALFANHLVFTFGLIVTFSLILFSEQLTGFKLRRIRALLLVANVVALLGSLTPWIVESIKAQNGTYDISFGWLSAEYFITLLVNCIIVVSILLYTKEHSKGIKKAQVNTILSSFALVIVAVILSNVALPYLFNNYSLTNAGSFASIALVIGVAYSIFKHRLFDLRLIVARSIAYVLSLVTLGGVFILTTFVASNFLFSNRQIGSTSIRWLYTLLAVCLAFIFPQLKTFFDKVTNRLFFRDAYDTQVFLDQFNKVLVSTFGLESLLKECAKIIEVNLKTTYCVFDIKETPNTPRLITGTVNHPDYSAQDVTFLSNLTSKTKDKLVVLDLIEDNEELRGVLQQNNVSVLARLTSNTTDTDIGYLILGPKKSGNLYSSQDLKVVEIITNELVIAVQNALHFEEIQRFNVTLQQKVDDATRKLKRTNQRLEELDETKDDFISMASHQLRTPLTSVKGYLSMVLEGDAGKLNSTQIQMLHQAFTSSQRMVFLITDLLNVSRLKTGKFVIDPSPVDLSQLVEEEVSQLVETAQVHSIKLSYKRPPAFPKLMLDETKTRQVIMNFIDNAIYYTPAGGHIDVQLEDKPSTIELRVVDDGIGVPKSEQHHLFTKFYRAGNARKVRPDGTGLGLFMAKKVVTAQGGSILFSSEEGKGSSFGFVIAKDRLKLPDSINPQDQTVTHISTAPGTVKPATKKKMASVR